MPIATPTTNIFQEAIKNFEANKVKLPKNYPLALIVGSPGTGKTRSLKSMPPLETAIINVENKPLSFSGSENFPYQFTDFKLPSDVDTCIANCFKEPTLKYIFIDSFAKWLEMLHKHASDIKKGYDIWAHYNACIGAFLDSIKNCGNKIVILTGIPEIVQEMQPNGLQMSCRRLAVMGKQWEGKVEKEFTIVLFTDVKKLPDGKVEYKFLTNTDGQNSAKTPEDMFKNEPRIDNDVWTVVQRIRKFYNLPE